MAKPISPTQARNQVKILFLDIETLPNLGWTWGKYEQNVLKFKQEWCVATFAAKWLGGKVFSDSIHLHRGYKGWSYNDEKIVKHLWNLLDEADIVVAHNGDSFDIKKTNARFIYYGLTPPSPYKTVDTKKVAKRAACFTSNKLDDLGEVLGEGRKIKTDFELWMGCIKGDRKSWERMQRYNERDVVLLEKIYHRLLPWAVNHPNIGNYAERPVCSKCGSKKIQFMGMYVALTRRYRRYKCQNCGGWGKEGINSIRGTTLQN